MGLTVGRIVGTDGRTVGPRVGMRSAGENVGAAAESTSYQISIIKIRRRQIASILLLNLLVQSAQKPMVFGARKSSC